jgi:N-acetylglucosamine kinase-like BadF-type ATPase
MTQEQFVMGIDGGGSKTAAAVLNKNRQVIGQGLSGSSNHHNVGLAQAKTNLWEAMTTAVAQANRDIGEITAVTWALAGIDRPEERSMFRQVAAEMLPGVPVVIANDSVAALVGGLGHHHGIVLIAGTGMIVYGENEQGESARAGGWGPFFDWGSGYSLVHGAMRLLAQKVDAGDDSSAALTQALLQAAGLQSPADWLGWVYDPAVEISHIAALVPAVLAAGETGDEVALTAVRQGVAGLVTAVMSVAQRLHPSKPTQLVLAGSLLLKSDFYRQQVIQAVQANLPHIQPQLPQADAAMGAALMAWEAVGS